VTGDDTVAWRDLVSEAEGRLAHAGVGVPGVDVRRIVERATGAHGSEYAFELDQPATARGVHFFDTMLERRLRGEPLQYVVGSWGFRRLDLLVDRRVLIPRPETETVVEHALAELERIRGRRGGDRVTVVDLGTGSGAIALSIASEGQPVDVWATDASPDALDVARANLAGLGRSATSVRLVEGDWYEALPRELLGAVDLVVSNPPYVAESDLLPAEVVDWEPRGALVAGATGTEAIELIIDRASSWLVADGTLVVELAPHQAASMCRRAVNAGFGAARIEADLPGRDRMLVARRATSG
jgi:release factor glutamine methyltransferase